MRTMWDLGSGLGGASEAFVQAGWNVIRIDNNPNLQHIPYTLNLDILEWKDWVDDLIIEEGLPDLIWCSPPCLEFSQAFSAPGPVARREGREFTPDLSLMFACRDVLDRVRPRYHVIENVVGACKHFTPHLGAHLQKLGPFVLWGLFPSIMVPEDWHHSKATNDVHSGNPMRANIRAYVPIEISQGLLEAITNQSIISDWI